MLSMPLLKTVGLLFLSNIFMTIAWYGHLKFRGSSLLMAIAASWLIALPEYALQVPANRMGYFNNLSGYQLKILQECIAITVFVIFAWIVLGEAPGLRHVIAFSLILAAIGVLFYKP